MHHYKASEWNKWDLHIHTPESGMANQFGNDWDKYVHLFLKVLLQTILQLSGLRIILQLMAIRSC